MVMTAETFGIGVKAIIEDGDKILLIRRRSDDAHNAGNWDIPGGRIEVTETLEDALVREVQEETALSISVNLPLEAHTFIRDDRQFIVMITYLCSVMSGQVKLSHEHQEFQWVSVDEVAARSHWLEPIMKNYQKLKKQTY